MFFLKKVFLVLFFVWAMYFGGAGTQSNSTMMQGMGFITVIAALVCLYILFKIVWRTMSALSSFLLFGAVVVFILYCLGMLGGNTSVSQFLGGEQAQKQAQTEAGRQSLLFDESEQVDDAEDEDLAELEMFGFAEDEAEEKTEAAQKNTVQNTPARAVAAVDTPAAGHMSASEQNNQGNGTQNGGLVGKIQTLLFGNQANQEAQTLPEFNPMDYPAVYGTARVITGSILQVGRMYIKLYGIDAPDADQTCADRYGRSYSCGRRSILWLQNWLENKELTCHILTDGAKNKATGVCFAGQYDVAAVVANAGWAVAYTANTDVYVPYEEQARQNLRGLWNGRFYKPWDWRKIKNRQVTVTVKRKNSSKNKGGLFGVF